MNRIISAIFLLLLIPISSWASFPPVSQEGTGVSILNDTSTGTINNGLATLTNANPAHAVSAATGTTSGVIGIVVSGAGTTGAALIQQSGQTNCNFDNATTSGDFVIPSLSTRGACHDAGTVASSAAIGQVLSTNTSSGTYTVLVNLAAAGGGGSGTGTVTTGVGLIGNGSSLNPVALATPVALPNGGTQCPTGATAFASLDPAPTNGEVCAVTNAMTCTAGTAVTAGGGTTFCGVTWNGSNWMPGGGVTSAASGGVTAVNAAAPITSTGGTTPTIGLTTPLVVAKGGTQCGAPTNYAGRDMSPTNGEICNFTDAPTCTIGTPVTAGGGSTNCQVTYNGTNWVPAGGASGSGVKTATIVGSKSYYDTTTTVSGQADFLDVAAFGLAPGNAGTTNDADLCKSGGGIVNVANCAANTLYTVETTNHLSAQWGQGTYSFTNTKTIELDNSLNGIIWQGMGGGNAAATGGTRGTILSFAFNPNSGSPLSITGSTFSTPTKTFTSTNSLSAGDDVVVETCSGTGNPGTYDSSGQVLVAGLSGTHFNTNLLPGTDPPPVLANNDHCTTGSVYWPQFLLTGANPFIVRDLAVAGPGAGTLNNEGSTIAFSVLNTTDGSTSLKGAYFMDDVVITNFYQSIAATGDFSGSVFNKMYIFDVNNVFYGQDVQAVLTTFTDPIRLGSDCDTFVQDSIGTQMTVKGGHVFTQNGCAVFHTLSTFNPPSGTANPLYTIKDAHIEYAGASCANCQMFLDDNSSGSDQTVTFEDNSMNISSCAKPTFAVNPGTVLNLSRMNAPAACNPGYGFIALYNTASNIRPPIFTWNGGTIPTDSNGNSYQDPVPEMLKCSSLPRTGCVLFNPSNGITDNNEPIVDEEDVKFYNGSAFQTFNWRSDSGNRVSLALPSIQGGIETEQLGTPGTCTATCTNTGVNNVYFKVMCTDVNGATFPSTTSWTPPGGECTCGNASANPTGANPVVVKWPRMNGAQYCALGYATSSGAEAPLTGSQTVNNNETVTSSATSGSMTTVDNTGNIVAGGQVLGKGVGSVAANLSTFPTCSSLYLGITVVQNDSNTSCSLGTTASTGGSTVCEDFCDGSVYRNTGMPSSNVGGDLTGSLPSPTLVASGVTAGSYTSTNLTVDAKGRITLASNGTPSGNIFAITEAANAATLSASCITAGCVDDNRVAVASSGNLAITTPPAASLTDGQYLFVRVNASGTAPNYPTWSAGAGVTLATAIPGDTGFFANNNQGGPLCGAAPTTGNIFYRMYYKATTLYALSCAQSAPSTLTIPVGVATEWSGTTANVPASTTDYIAFGQNAAQSVIGTKSNAQNIWSGAGVASQLQCFASTNAGAVGDVFTLQDNGSNTALTCTVTTRNCQDVTHTVAIATTDVLDIVVNPSANNTNATGVASCAFQING